MPSSSGACSTTSSIPRLVSRNKRVWPSTQAVASLIGVLWCSGYSRERLRRPWSWCLRIRSISPLILFCSVAPSGRRAHSCRPSVPRLTRHATKPSMTCVDPPRGARYEWARRAGSSIRPLTFPFVRDVGMSPSTKQSGGTEGHLAPIGSLRRAGAAPIQRRPMPPECDLLPEPQLEPLRQSGDRARR